MGFVSKIKGQPCIKNRYEAKLVLKDENERQNELVQNIALRAVHVSAVIMTFLIAFTYFCALSPFNIEMIGVILATVYLFVYIKFTIACGTLKDVGYKKIWLTLYRTVGLALYLVSAVLCMLGIG